MHHPKADVERLYFPRREGGRGLIQLEMNFKTTAIGLHKYLSTNNDWILQLVLFNKTRQMKQPVQHYRRKKSKEKLR